MVDSWEIAIFRQRMMTGTPPPPNPISVVLFRCPITLWYAANMLRHLSQHITLYVACHSVIRLSASIPWFFLGVFFNFYGLLFFLTRLQFVILPTFLVLLNSPSFVSLFTIHYHTLCEDSGSHYWVSNLCYLISWFLCFRLLKNILLTSIFLNSIWKVGFLRLFLFHRTVWKV